MCRCGPLPPGGLWTEVKRSRVSIHSTEKVEEGIGWVCMCAFWGEGEGRGGEGMSLPTRHQQGGSLSQL